MKTQTYTKLAIATVLTAASPFAFSQGMEAELETPADQVVQQPAAVIEKGTLTNVISDSATFAILTAALKATGLDETLAGNDNYTIFAPTDAAFGKMPEGSLDLLLLPENKEKLRSLLLYHVVPGKVMSAGLYDTEVKTVNGEKLNVDVDGTEIKVNGATVFSPDVEATNGVMHSVGEVIVPESLDGFANLED